MRSLLSVSCSPTSLTLGLIFSLLYGRSLVILSAIYSAVLLKALKICGGAWLTGSSKKALDILPAWAVKLISGGADVASAAVGYAGDAASYVGDTASSAWQAAKGWFGGSDDSDAMLDRATGSTSNQY